MVPEGRGCGGTSDMTSAQQEFHCYVIFHCTTERETVDLSTHNMHIDIGIKEKKSYFFIAISWALRRFISVVFSSFAFVAASALQGADIVDCVCVSVLPSLTF